MVVQLDALMSSNGNVYYKDWKKVMKKQDLVV